MNPRLLLLASSVAVPAISCSGFARAGSDAVIIPVASPQPSATAASKPADLGFRDLVDWALAEGDPKTHFPLRFSQVLGLPLKAEIIVTSLAYQDLTVALRYFAFEIVPVGGRLELVMLYHSGNQGWLWRVANDDDVLGMGKTGPGMPLSAVPSGQFPAKCRQSAECFFAKSFFTAKYSGSSAVSPK
jgi:hypothetical protein